MDPGTIVGLVVAIVAIFASMIMEGGSPGSMFLVPPMLLVFVGTFGVAMASGTLKDTLKAGAFAKMALLSKKTDSSETIATLVTLAERARKEGLLALEDSIKEVNDPFLKSGLEMAVDGTDPEELREILESQIDAKRKSDGQGAKFYNDMGGFAPTIGIIGTVLGLVHVLENLSDPEQLGHLIAAAFLATLWGVMSANVFWLPMANKIKRASGIECHHMEVLVEGVLAIQAGANPRMIAQKLRSLMPDAAPADEKKAA